MSLQRDVNTPLSLSIVPYPVHDFGSVLVGQSAKQIFTLTNTGNSALQNMQSGFYLSLNFQFEGGSFPGTGGTCAATLGPGQSCEMVIVFSPQYSGTFSEAVRVSFEDASGAKTTDSPLLFGKATPAP